MTKSTTKELKEIILIDDNKSLQEIMRLGFNNLTQNAKPSIFLTQKNNAPEGIEYLKKNYKKIGLILLDITMPRMDGWQALEIIKKNPTINNIAVIMFSNHSNNHKFEEKIKRLNAMGFIQKPNHRLNMGRTILLITTMLRIARIQRITEARAAIEESVASYAGDLIEKIENALLKRIKN